MYSKARTFSHIYVEAGVRDHPRTARILKRFPSSCLVTVDDYQNVFGRGRQDFWRQKGSPKLVLAAKKDQFLYAGNAFLQGSVSPNFCYNALVLNCPYDCHYCYLQGMYGGANLVAFVNLEEYFTAAAAAIRERKDPRAPLELAISYDTDLLALEGILGYVREWAAWARGQPSLRIEVRTKSAPLRFLETVEPTDALRIAWTLSPETVAQRYETGAPPLEKRLAALQEAAQKGWRISLCLDPVLKVADWRTVYGEFLDRLGSGIPWAAVDRVEVGVFRMSPAYFRKMQKRPGTDLLHYPYEHANNAVSYNKEERESLTGMVASRLRKHISHNKILIWT